MTAGGLAGRSPADACAAGQSRIGEPHDAPGADTYQRLVLGQPRIHPRRCAVGGVVGADEVQTALAWKLHVTLGRVGTSMTHPGLMFIGPWDTIDGGPPAVPRRLRVGPVIASVGVWRVYRVTAPGHSARCVGS